MNNARSKDDLPPSPPALKAESEQEKEMQKMRKVGGGGIFHTFTTTCQEYAMHVYPYFGGMI